MALTQNLNSKINQTKSIPLPPNNNLKMCNNYKLIIPWPYKSKLNRILTKLHHLYLLMLSNNRMVIPYQN